MSFVVVPGAVYRHSAGYVCLVLVGRQASKYGDFVRVFWIDTPMHDSLQNMNSNGSWERERFLLEECEEAASAWLT